MGTRCGTNPTPSTEPSIDATSVATRSSGIIGVRLGIIGVSRTRFLHRNRSGKYAELDTWLQSLLLWLRQAGVLTLILLALVAVIKSRIFREYELRTLIIDVCGRPIAAPNC